MRNNISIGKIARDFLRNGGISSSMRFVLEHRMHSSRHEVCK